MNKTLFKMHCVSLGEKFSLVSDDEVVLKASIDILQNIISNLRQQLPSATNSCIFFLAGLQIAEHYQKLLLQNSYHENSSDKEAFERIEKYLQAMLLLVGEE